MTIAVWSMMAAASFTLGLTHAAAWLQQRANYANLMFALAAVSVAVIALCELSLMHAPSIQSYADILRWAQVPVLVLAAAIVGFVHFRFAAGRLWLGLAACALRLVVLIIAFTAEVGVTYREIHSLQQIELFADEIILVARGTSHPWRILSEVSSILLFAFVIDAMATVFRRGRRSERRMALIVGITFAAFIVAAAGHSALVNAGLLTSPYIISASFFGCVLVMGYSLGADAGRAAGLGAQLTSSERRMDLAVSAAGLGLWEWDVRRDSVWANERTHELLELAHGERLDVARLLAAVHVEDREAVRQWIEEALADADEFDKEYRIGLADGKFRWISSRGRVQRTANGKPEMVRGVTMDITARKSEAERLRLWVEAAPNAVVAADSRGVIVLANQQAADLFGYAYGELAGRHVDVLIPAHKRSRHFQDMQNYFADARQRPTGTARDVLGQRKDGESIPLEIGLTPIATSEGTIVLATIVDLRQRRRVEMQISMQREELAHLARVATMGELSAALGHELNQPLAAIVSNAQAAQNFLEAQSPDLNEVRDIVRDIADDGKRASEVIKRQRDFLKKQPTQRQSVNLNEIVEEALRLMNADLISRNVIVSLALEEDLPPVTADRVQLHQVMLNLLLNACQAMEPLKVGPKQLRVQTRRADLDSLGVFVTDCGVGIPAGQADRLFQPFYSTKPNGMGLGLVVSKTLIEDHGGCMHAANNTDRGATFGFVLPLREEQRV